MALRLIATIDDPSGSQSTFAPRAINNSAQIAGYYTTSEGTFGFAEFTPGTFTPISRPIGVIGPTNRPLTVATGINDAGQIVGYSTGWAVSPLFPETNSFIYNGQNN